VRSRGGSRGKGMMPTGGPGRSAGEREGGGGAGWCWAALGRAREWPTEKSISYHMFSNFNKLVLLFSIA
jgi:hypothetical protein